ncbi:MAG: single-stranded-DNA-specific exonuclease RecJ [Ginsengibacter sp.]
MEKRWKILTADESTVAKLAQSLKINSSICKILVQRGIDTFEKAKDFFRPQLSQLHDPFLMKDMDKAVERILAAIENNEKILIFGDYDVDGTTSAALLYRFLKKIYTEENIDFYVPHRYREGYGISKLGIDFAKKNEFELVIAIDCGIKSVDLITYANTLGINFIICDHHMPGEILPPAVAILNPKQKDCNYPYKELCGCGVGFKLISALSHRLHIADEEYLCYLDLVVTAIGADIVPITGENRILAFYGIKRLNENPCAGIKALKELSGKVEKYSITNVVFMIAPRVNAAGRMDDATKAVKLFIEDDEQKAKEYAEMLHSDNTHRKDADTTITEQALAMIMADETLINRKTTVLYQADWHKGVVGIVASRLIETFHRPTVILSMGDSVAGGSARSVPGFDLYEAIDACSEYLLGYGGHFAAAGMTLEVENIAAFSKKFEEVVSASIDPSLLIPEIVIDEEISFKEVNKKFLDILHQMEPYGPLNLRPVFITRNVENTPWSKLVKEDHIRFVVKNSGITLTGIGFFMSDKFPLLQENKLIDMVYTIDENEWNGEVSLQLKVIDFRASNIVGQNDKNE